MQADVLGSIRVNYNALSAVQRRIADFVQQNAEKVMFQSITELAQACETSETTIMRFLRKVGFTSYQVFRVELAQGLQQENPRYVCSDISRDDSTDEIREKVISATVNSLQDIRTLLPDEIIEKAAAEILEARFIYIFALGASGYIAGDFFHKLVRLGFKCSFCQDPHLMAIQSSHFERGDLVICVSHSGESDIILESGMAAKSLGIPLLALTSYPRSSLALAADTVLLSSSAETAYRPDAMSSRILQLTIIDVLTIVLTLKKGQSGIEAVGRSQRAVARQKR